MKKAKLKYFIYIFIFAIFLSCGSFFNNKTTTLNVTKVFDDIPQIVTETEIDYVAASLPSSYDLRDYIDIKVENQQTYGICYSFAGLTMLETYLAKTYNEYYDFSDIHLACSKYMEDGQTTGSDTVSFDVAGGNFYHFFNYCMKDGGPILEEEMPMSLFYNSGSTSVETLEDIAQTYYKKYEDEFTKPITVNQFVNLTSKNNIKSHIQTYGSCMASIYVETSTFPAHSYNGKSTQYLPGSTATESNHAISIIGWDDNYKPSGWASSGAYLCLNSWGEDTYGGVFYVSYNDSLIQTNVFGVTSAEVNNQDNYVSNLDNSMTSQAVYTISATETVPIATITDLGTKSINKYINEINVAITATKYSDIYINFISATNVVTFSDKNYYLKDNTINACLNNKVEYSLNNTSTESLVKFTLKSPIKITAQYAVLIVKATNTTRMTGLSASWQNNALNYTYWGSNFQSMTNSLDAVGFKLLSRFKTSNSNTSQTNVTSNLINQSSSKVKNNQTFKHNTLSLDLSSLTENVTNIDIYKTSCTVNTAAKTATLNKTKYKNSFDTTLNGGILTIKQTKDLNFGNYVLLVETANHKFYKVFEVINYSVNEYSINYSLDGGINNANNISLFTELDSSIKIYSPTKSGYKFLGWYYDSSFLSQLTGKTGSDYIEITNPNKNITLYAKWEKIPETFTVTYNLDGGENHETNPSSFIEGSTITINPPTKDGFNFLGWYYDSLFTSYAGKNKFSISPNKNISLYAKWEKIPETFTITYYLNDGTNNTNNVETFKENSTVTIYNPTKKGYTFLGWYLDNSFLNQLTGTTGSDGNGDYIKTSNTTDNLTLYAKWEKIPETFTITYYLDGGDNNSNNVESFIVNSTVKIYNPTKDGYTFEGWYLDNSFLNQLTGTTGSDANGYYIKTFNTTNNLTLYAKWEKIPETFTITYYLNGGDNNSNNVESFIENSSVTIYNPTKDGYTFLGWFYDSSFTNLAGTNNFDITINQNINLYAKWQAIEMIAEKQPLNITKTYCNENFKLEFIASHPVTTQINYQWYKITDSKSDKIVGATTNVLYVKNVADSGSYKCVATCILIDDSLTLESNIVKVTINKATYNLSWNYTTPFKYDNTAKKVDIIEAYDINYIITHQTKTNAGNYKSSISFLSWNENYNMPNLSTLNWQILPAELKITVNSVNVETIEQFNNYNNFSYSVEGTIYDGYDLNVKYSLINSVNPNVKIISASYSSNSNYKVSVINGQISLLIKNLTTNIEDIQISSYNEQGYTEDSSLKASIINETDLSAEIKQIMADKKLIAYSILNISLLNNTNSTNAISVNLNRNLKDKNMQVYLINNNTLVKVESSTQNNIISFNAENLGSFIIVEEPVKTDMLSIIISVITVFVLTVVCILIIIKIRKHRNSQYF